MHTIIMIPGHGCKPQMFADQVAVLSQHYHCICVDLCDYRTVEEVIAGVLSQAPEKFIIMGFSLGAIIASRLVQRAPERIQAYIHISAPYEGPSHTFASELQHLCEVIPTIDISELAEIGYKKYFPDRTENDPLFKVFEKMIMETGKQHYVDQANMLLQPWSLNVFIHDGHPVLIIGGALDHRALPQYHKFMATQLKTSELYLIPNARHFVTLEQPATVTAVISEWLQKMGFTEKNQSTKRSKL